MKKSSAIHLTLTATAVALVAGCAEKRPEQRLRGYCDPKNQQVCYEQPRAGYIPMYYPMYFGGYYYNSQGYAYDRPGGTRIASAPKPLLNRSVTTSATSKGSSSRGGFGSTALGRSTVSS